MATFLTELLIDRIDLVDKGANPGAHIALFKRDTPDTPTSIVVKFDGATIRPSDVALVQGMVQQRTADVMKASEGWRKDPTGAARYAAADIRREFPHLFGDNRIEKREKEDAVNTEDQQVIAKAHRNETLAVSKRDAACGSIIATVHKRMGGTENEAQREVLKSPSDGTSRATRQERLDYRALYDARVTDDPAPTPVAKSWSEMNRSEKADGKLGELAAAHAKVHKISVAQAYDKVLKSDEGRALYTALVDRGSEDVTRFLGELFKRGDTETWRIVKRHLGDA